MAELATASLARSASFTAFAGLLLTTFFLAARSTSHRVRSPVVGKFKLPCLYKYLYLYGVVYAFSHCNALSHWERDYDTNKPSLNLGHLLRRNHREQSCFQNYLSYLRSSIETAGHFSDHQLLVG
nr:hypothetical protein HmN_000165300 [Hymenolepis microstoma]